MPLPSRHRSRRHRHPLRRLWLAPTITAPPVQRLEVEFNTGECFSLPAEYLRVESPAAEARDAAGRPKLVHSRRHVGITGLQPVGNYAVRIEVKGWAVRAGAFWEKKRLRSKRDPQLTSNTPRPLSTPTDPTTTTPPIVPQFDDLHTSGIYQWAISTSWAATNCPGCGATSASCGRAG